MSLSTERLAARRQRRAVGGVGNESRIKPTTGAGLLEGITWMRGDRRVKGTYLVYVMETAELLAKRKGMSQSAQAEAGTLAVEYAVASWDKYKPELSSRKTWLNNNPIQSAVRDTVRRNTDWKGEVVEPMSLATPIGHDEAGYPLTLADTITSPASDVLTHAGSVAAKRSEDDDEYRQFNDVLAAMSNSDYAYALRLASEGYSTAEIAEEIGVNRSTVRTWVSPNTATGRAVDAAKRTLEQMDTTTETAVA